MSRRRSNSATASVTLWPIGSLAFHAALNAMVISRVTHPAHSRRQRQQLGPGRLGFASLQRCDRCFDGLKHHGRRRPACYSATRLRFRAVFRHVRTFAGVPAVPGSFDRICGFARSRILRETARSPVRLPAPPQNLRSCRGRRSADPGNLHGSDWGHSHPAA
jgi:hypothetical protein